MLGNIAKVALEGATFAFDKRYSYALPENENPGPGSRVVVPFGRANTKRQGIILSVCTGETDGLKEVFSVIDKEPVLNDELVGMCEYMKEHTFCTYYDAVKAMLPAGINYRLADYYTVNTEFSSSSLLNDQEKELFDFILASKEIGGDKIKKTFGDSEDLLTSLTEKEAVLKNCSPIRRMGDATQKWVRLSPEVEEENLPKLTARQREILGVIADAGCVSVKELKYFTGVTEAVVNALIQKNLVIAYEKEVFRTPYRNIRPAVRSEIQLTDEQNAAFTGMINQINSGCGGVSLLYGVTGSGKTQVFLKLADEVTGKGLGVILMVPEIALTPQMINIFSSRYGNKIAVFHSAMSAGQRMDEWKRIKNGEALFAIGTRSAVFAPFKKLGLIIMDEEHEHTYKSEKNPKFHARDLAKYRAAKTGALLCLASATPSVESYTAALLGKYSLYTLKNRYGNARLPEVSTVDMKKEILSGNSSSISRELCEGITEALKNKKQVIVLLNRRGHNTYVSCPDCGYVAACPNCSISLTYHSANKRLMCHYCGYSVKAESACPECGQEHMKFMGMGTQKITEELGLLFPEAKILRVDADSTVSRESYSAFLTEFASGKYDIMVGTQMVAKGLDFPNVTLVGVLGADSAAYSEDFRSFERTFSLLTQVVGRAGRGDAAGKAVVQTINPEGNLIDLARRQDYDSFYKEEILTRKLMIYPPYCDICTVFTSSQSKEMANEAILSIFGKIKEIINKKNNEIKLIVLGPSPAALPKINNKYRFRMIIKCKNNKQFRDMLRSAIDIKNLRDVTISVDINPETIV